MFPSASTLSMSSSSESSKFQYNVCAVLRVLFLCAPRARSLLLSCSTHVQHQVIRLAPQGLSEVATLKTGRRKITGSAGSKLR